MTLRQIKRLADPLEALYNIPILHRIQNDPVAILHRYCDPIEIETVGWLTASFSYGRASFFHQPIEKILSLAKESDSFYKYLLTFNLSRERHRFRDITYRFNSANDILALIYIMSQIISEYGTLQAAFMSGFRDTDPDIGSALSRFVEKMRNTDTKPIYGTTKKPAGLLHFFPSPAEGSACKRWNLYLRWMVRPNQCLDFGIWKAIFPSQLIIPLDTHITRIGQYLGLTSRKTPDWVMAKEITQNLMRFDPNDPLKYDFPLCHLGISGLCPTVLKREKCQICPLLPACPRGRRGCPPPTPR
ncbi:MAG: TIGR02757 family protein [Nitrospirota bacterium]